MTRELKNAVEALASAVRKVLNLVNKPSPTREESTHAKEFLPEMERMLVDQLATSVDDENSRRSLLVKYELDFLQEDLTSVETERREIEEELDNLSGD